jgi:subtilisin-like proprotein convertase family protein
MSLTADPSDYLYAGNDVGEVYKSSISTTGNSLIQKLTDLNLTISDASPAISTINFPPPSAANKESSIQGISSVQVVIDEVTHQRTGDLTFTLEHLGTNQTIIFEVGADGQNFISTILSDDNTTPISNGTAPFTGYFKPDNPLNVFNGIDPYGDWILTVTDNYSGNDGILSSWSLIITYDGATDVETNTELYPDRFVLEQNYPNPFNPSTTIKYSISQISSVTLKVYDVLGNEVAILDNEEKSAGIYEVKFNGSNLSSGIYFYKLQAGSFIDTKKMILMK